MEIYQRVCKTVADIKKQYGNLDAYRLSDAMGLLLNPCNFGDGENAIKGFIIEHMGEKCISYNDDLPDAVKESIICHEIGHAVLHSPIGLQGYTDVSLYNESSQKEKEANLFTAEYLLSDEDVIDALNDDATFFDAAKSLGIPPQLLDFKFRLLKWKGYKFNDTPIYAENNFFKKIK